MIELNLAPEEQEALERSAQVMKKSIEASICAGNRRSRTPHAPREGLRVCMYVHLAVGCDQLAGSFHPSLPAMTASAGTP